MLIKKGKVVTLSILVAFCLIGCSRTKQLEQTNREQARVIADLNQKVASLQEELARTKVSQEELARTKAELERKLKEAPVSGSQQKANYVK